VSKVTPAFIITDIEPGHPAHPIAPGGPVDPGYGVEGPVDPGYGFPLPPVGIMPPIAAGGAPTHPIAPPTYPVDPGYDLPTRPGVWPTPPRPVDPAYGVPIPIRPNHDLPIYGAHPDNDLPLPPGAVWPPLPPSVTGEILAFVWIVGVGYRWVCIDLSLKPDHPIYPPSGVPEPTHPIAGPPTAQPK
jgi:hypothetical protein